jgi:hypothetical protein
MKARVSWTGTGSLNSMLPRMKIHLIIQFMSHSQKSFETLTKKHFDECIVTCWWQVKFSIHERNNTNIMLHGEKLPIYYGTVAEYTSSSFPVEDRTLVISRVQSWAFSARLAQCDLIKPQQQRMFIQINIIWLCDFCVRMLLIISFFPMCIAIIKYYCSRLGETTQVWVKRW